MKTLLNYVTNTGELIIWTNIETLIKLTKKNYGLLTIRAYFLDIYNPNTSSIFSKIIVVDAVQFCCQTLSFLSILLKALRKTFFFFFCGWYIFEGKLACYMSKMLKKLEGKFSDCSQNFLDGARISISYFFCPAVHLYVCLSVCLSVCQSVAHHISGKIHHVIIIFGTHV